MNLIIANTETIKLKEFEMEILKELNNYERSRIEKYYTKNKKEKIIAFYLLKLQLQYFNESSTIFNLIRNEFHKPYFENTTFNFSISHSCNYVVCLASKNCNIGIDIEFENISLVNYKSILFSPAEIALLKNENNPKLFFYLHTRKEAFSKAIGMGIFMNYENFEAIDNSIFYNEKNWQLKTVDLIENYSLSIVTSIAKDDISKKDNLTINFLD